MHHFHLLRHRTSADAPVVIEVPLSGDATTGVTGVVEVVFNQAAELLASRNVTLLKSAPAWKPPLKPTSVPFDLTVEPGRKRALSAAVRVPATLSM